ncbi:MAG TPA: YfiR family protein [Rhodocyclaceae bacterium]
MNRLRRLCLYLLLAAPAGTLAADVVGEAEFKAAAIYNLLQFVQWPEQALAQDGTLRLCQISAAPLAPELARLAGRQVHKRSLTLRRIDGTAEEAAPCDAIWVEIDRLNSLGRMATVARQRPLLLLGEGPDAVDRGAMIGLAIDKGHARLRVDNAAAKESGLTIGARLLRLAAGSKDNRD